MKGLLIRVGKLQCLSRLYYTVYFYLCKDLSVRQNLQDLDEKNRILSLQKTIIYDIIYKGVDSYENSRR